jgi:LAS superfamily LD-carboxypeptidase LdcB
LKRYARRKKFKVKKLFILLFTVMLCVMAGKVLHSSLTTPFLGNITHHMASEDHGWNLILVNRENYIPADYEVQLTELSNGKKVDSRIYPELQEMFDDARAQGYSLFVREGYRTQEEQQQLMDEKIEAYENEGKSKPEAKKLAEQWVAIPGTSEHQLGIAVDINADTTKSSSDDVYNWLAENAHTYGFIKRYPSNKTDITGVINEPWHYRYVGKEVASKIYSQGICLEEYIDTLGYADSGH